MTVHRLQRAGKKDRRADFVEMARELADELAAAAAMGDVAFGLKGLILGCDARGKRLQQRLAVLAPAPFLDELDALDQIVDTSRYLLAVARAASDP